MAKTSPSHQRSGRTLILQLCSVYIMLTIICKSATVHNGGQCAQKETIAIVKLQVIKFGGLCKQEESFEGLLLYVVFLFLVSGFSRNNGALQLPQTAKYRQLCKTHLLTNQQSSSTLMIQSILFKQQAAGITEPCGPVRVYQQLFGS